MSPSHLLYITNRIPVAYNPSSKCYKWLEFLSKTFDPGDVVFLQEWCGAILYRKVFGVGKCVILVGPTRTGKGTFIYVIESLIGSNSSVKIPLQLIKDSHERVRTYKKLLCSWSDIDKMSIQDSGYIKTLISGDKQSARDLYKSSIEFQPYIKVLQSANETPQTEIDRDDWWERFSIIFVHTHQYFDNDPKYNPDLKAELTTPEELSGVLNWALEGLSRYIKNGYRFSNCPGWKETRRRWLFSSDPISSFIESDWIEYVVGFETTKREFYDCYLRYCVMKDVRTPVTIIKFGQVINSLFGWKIEDSRSSTVLPDGSRPPVWRGVRIKEEWRK